MMCRSAQFAVHDLLRIDAAELLSSAHSEGQAVPPWVPDALRLAPCVVVRRGCAEHGFIPTGIRGRNRHQRWAFDCPPGLVLAAASPWQLLHLPIAEARTSTIPALQALHQLERGPTERGPTERSLTERSFTERGPTERGLTERSLTERGSTERNPTERSLTERSLTERGLTGLEGAFRPPFGHTLEAGFSPGPLNLLVQQRWASLEWLWGPAGSVGFELFSGVETATTTSDLDIVISAPTPFSNNTAKQMCADLDELPCRIDVRVETPAGGFHLNEYATGGPVMLRTNLGETITANPWQLQATRLDSQLAVSR